MNNNILLVDDKKDFADSFSREAAALEMCIIHKTNYEEMVDALSCSAHKLSAIILDIKCLMRRDQQIEHANFIPVALSYLDQNYVRIPRYVLTGDDTEFDRFKDLYIHEHIFLKTPEGLNALFEKLKYCVEHFHVARLMRENPILFRILGSGKMVGNSESLLISILEDLWSDKPGYTVKGICTNIRSFHELIYKSINQRNKVVVPDRMFKPNGMIEFNKLMKYLSGNPDTQHRPTTIVYQNNTISNLSNFIYWSCGEYVHEDPLRTYKIGRHAIESLTHGLIELTIWSDQY